MIYSNSIGILIGNTSSSTVELNEIFRNETGISIQDEASASITNNKIYQNSGEAIGDNSENESNIRDNELFDNGDKNLDDENGSDDGGCPNLGALIVEMLGSENLSNDPKVIAIPLGDKIGTDGSDNDVEEGDEEENNDNDNE
jgi:parallel beta-helix repeat protein